mgnify:CR=1 FL=1
MADNYDNLYSCTVVDEDGSRIGAVSQVYLDDATAEPTFVAARVGFFGNKEVLVPLVGAFISDDLMQVPHSADLVKQAPERRRRGPSSRPRGRPPRGGRRRAAATTWPSPSPQPGRPARRNPRPASAKKPTRIRKIGLPEG